MLLSSNVSFRYNIKKGAVCQKGPLPDYSALFDIVRNSLNTDSFELILTRTVQIIKHTQIPDEKPVVIDIGSEDLNVIVMDKLTYPSNIRDFLIQKYNNMFNFDELNLPWNKPVYFSGVREIEELGPRNPNTGDKTTYTRRYIECRPLTDKDIVVDKNCLHQIWPVKQDSISFEILRFLKAKEIVY